MKKLTFAFTSILSLVACLDTEIVDTEIDDTETNDSPEIGQVTRIATNGLYPPTAFAVLGATSLSSAKLTSTSIAAFLDDPYERAVLGYVVKCALNNGDSFSAGGYTFPGQVGLAPNWKTTAITSSQGKSMGGCFWSLLNSTTTSITISVRGNGLTSTGPENNTYTLEEGAFAGNIFASFGSVIGTACMGVAQAAGDSGSSLPYRECTEPDAANPGYTLCGLVDLGLCLSVCTSNGAGGYSECDGWANPVSAFVMP